MEPIRTLVPAALLVLSWGCSIILPLDEYSESDGATLEASAVDGGGDSSSVEASSQTDAADGSSREGGTSDGIMPKEAAAPDAGSCLDKCIGQWCEWFTVPPTALRSVHGTSLDNLWAAGDASKVLRFEPKACKWADQSPQTKSAVSFRAVRARSATEVHVVSSAEEMWRLDGGKSWTQVITCKANITPSALNALGEASGKLFAAGDGGLLLEYDATSKCWEPRASAGKNLLALSSGSGSMLYVGGISGYLEQWDTAAKKFVPHICNPPTTVTVRGLWSTGVATDAANYALVAVGEENPKWWSAVHTAGMACFKKTGAAARWNAVAATTPKDVWGVGDGGAVGRVDTTAGAYYLTPMPSPGSENLTSVWVHPAGANTWVVATSDQGKIFARLF
jgi:hypothetical protein